MGVAIGRLSANRQEGTNIFIPPRSTYFCIRFPSRISHHMGVLISHGCGDRSPVRKQTSGTITFIPHRPTYFCNRFPSRICYHMDVVISHGCTEWSPWHTQTSATITLTPIARPIFGTDFCNRFPSRICYHMDVVIWMVAFAHTDQWNYYFRGFFIEPRKHDREVRRLIQRNNHMGAINHLHAGVNVMSCSRVLLWCLYIYLRKNDQEVALKIAPQTHKGAITCFHTIVWSIDQGVICISVRWRFLSRQCEFSILN